MGKKVHGYKFCRYLPLAVFFTLWLVIPANAFVTNINPNQKPLIMRTADIVVNSYGAIAETSVIMGFYNPNPWALGGEVDFRLLYDSTATGYSVGKNGEPRQEAQPFDRTQYHFQLDGVEKSGMDVSLLQLLRNGFHKMRFFPIEARGKTDVELRHIGNLLPADERGEDLFYFLPFTWGYEGNDSIEQGGVETDRTLAGLTFEMNVHKNRETPYALDRNGEKIAFDKSGDIYRFRYAFGRRGTAPDVFDNTGIKIVIPGAGNEESLVEDTPMGKFFYATVNSGRVAPAIAQSAKRTATRIGIAWDCSASAQLRDRGKEFQFLDAYFKRLLAEKDVEELRVSLLCFRNDTEPLSEYTVNGTGWGKLRNKLVSLPYDGATNLCAARSEMGSSVDEWLLFSDGYDNYGLHTDHKPSPPIHSILTTTSASMASLHALSTASGGAVIDLTWVSPAEGVDLLLKPRARLTHMRGRGVSDLLASAQTIASGDVLVIAGRLASEQGVVNLAFGSGDSAVAFNIPVGMTSESSPLAAKEWGRMKIDELLSAPLPLDMTEIQKTGRDFGLVSRATALAIPPDPEMARRAREKVSYRDIVMGKGNAVRQKDTNLYPIDQLKKEWSDMIARIQSAGGTKGDAEAGSPGNLYARSSQGPFRRNSPEFLWFDSLQKQAQLALRDYGDGSSYREQLRSVPPQKVYEFYLSEYPHYWTTPDFYIDTSEVLFEHGQTELGLRTLSSLMEVDTENKGVMRTLGYKLAELGSPVARFVFEKILEIAPDDPQSYRDLAFACASNGDTARAIDLFDFIATHTWEKEYAGIQLAALRDLNTVARFANLRVDSIDPDLLDFTPIDIRVTLGADRYDAGLLLELVDEREEVVKEGILAFDYMQGSGVDELLLPKARSGRYTVKVRYTEDTPPEKRIPTLAIVTVVTRIGTTIQSEWISTARLHSSHNEAVPVMSFYFNAEGAVKQADAPKAAGAQSKKNMGIAIALLAIACLCAFRSLFPQRARKKKRAKRK